jgi:uncharacterized Zn finger protein
MSRYGRRRFPKYHSVASRREKSGKRAASLEKGGRVCQPIVIEGRAIAKSFWGKAWCKNLESYSDYENRLPRGRTYVRHGAVLHLEIGPGRIDALVDGSRVYDVEIEIKHLAPKRWKAFKSKTSGELDSLVDLLEGRLSKAVMALVSDPTEGLFPLSKHISLECNCPDWATMCKHVAAVLYGIGARLDHEPELLFTLRGVDPSELIEDALEGTLKPSNTSRPTLDLSELADVFGDSIDLAPVPHKSTKRSPRQRKRSPKTKPGPSPKLTPRAEKLLAQITTHPGERSPALAKSLRLSPSKIRAALTELRHANQIQFRGANRTGGYFPRD